MYFNLDFVGFGRFDQRFCSLFVVVRFGSDDDVGPVWWRWRVLVVMELVMVVLMVGFGGDGGGGGGGGGGDDGITIII